MTQETAQKKPAAVQRDARIVKAAEALFLQHGLRGTTMEAIARQAGVAKPTLYSYYPDKETVFQAVVAQVNLRLQAAILEAMDRAAPGAGMVAQVLITKYGVLRELLAGSAYAQDLTEAKYTWAKGEAEDLHSWVLQTLADRLRQSGDVDMIDRLPMVLAAVNGVATLEGAPDDLATQISFVTDRLLARA